MHNNTGYIGPGQRLVKARLSEEFLGPRVDYSILSETIGLYFTTAVLKEEVLPTRESDLF
jgi:hypothetical protein